VGIRVVLYSVAGWLLLLKETKSEHLLVVTGLEVGAQLDEQPQCAELPIACSDYKRRVAVAVFGIWTRAAALDQPLCVAGAPVEHQPAEQLLDERLLSQEGAQRQVVLEVVCHLVQEVGRP
jgi:hypothetical protein